VPAVADNARELTIPSWASTFTVEAPAGGADLKVAITGTDDAAIVAAFVDVVAGNGPREFSAGFPGHGRVDAIFVASATGSAAYIAEAEAEARS
jgi:hypothetical protein